MTNAPGQCPTQTPIRTVGTMPVTSLTAGANIKAVQQMLGHASAAMTLDVYAGLFADDLDAVAERLDAAVTQRQAESVADFLRTNGTEGPNQPPARNRERGRDLR